MSQAYPRCRSLKDVNTIGKRVRVCRFHIKELSQKEFTAAHQLHPSVLSMIERGRREPSLHYVQTLAKAFGVGEDFITEGKNPPSWWNEKQLEHVLNCWGMTKRTWKYECPPAIPKPMNEFLIDEFNQLRTPYLSASPKTRELVRCLLTIKEET